MRAIVRKLLFLWAGLLVSPIFHSANAAAPACQEKSFEGNRYVLCTVDPQKDDLRLFWKNSDGEPFRRFPRLARTIADSGKSLVFALNAGMYHTDFSPLGLYVEDGEELQPANIAPYSGKDRPVPNFYKNPNGVFYVDKEKAGIVATKNFLKSGIKPLYATQSGPMLVIDNKLNPILIKGSKERTRRSGVGVCTEGKISFAISTDNMNFYDFARLFKDELRCPNALFLDGGGGAGFYSPDLKRSDFSWHGGYGPFFGLIK
ncbi:phosphodiester glycosidase family protein [Falsochrobactrum ovis]|uniref:Uncharacterized protein YigE (DUF2233 family) n=1 Tax=Falsochrobactrum ovis TaxID=1293442 RepID=A0A364JT17_9HYPH|nr:phosphodiester glycosidase family protein [Falsochrobactrum ovis]RAK26595.1 uncharacterized protein YigE (DUF2233 family) [Falsochrobactrum ovis]